MRFFDHVLFLPAWLSASNLVAAGQPPTLELDARRRDFCLPGVDDREHCLKDYASSRVLVMVFTCNHCPTAQLYETRIKQLAADYKARDVGLVTIQPNDPEAVRLDELGYTDVSDSLPEMKIRYQYRHFNFPDLYDGDTQSVARAYGPTATPHVFIFDAERKLRYQGRVDNNPRPELVTSHDARKAIDALLANQPIPLAQTPAIGCSTKWASKGEGRAQERERLEREPVTLNLARADELKALATTQWESCGWLILGDLVRSLPRRNARTRSHVASDPNPLRKLSGRCYAVRFRFSLSPGPGSGNSGCASAG